MVENNLCDFIWTKVKPANLQDPLAPENAEDNTYVYFRDKVKIDTGSPVNLRLEVCCYSECEIYFNGEYLGRGAAPCSYKYPIYDVFDLTGKEMSGTNIIAALCYFDSRYYRIWWADIQDAPYSKPGFFFRLICVKDGVEDVVLQSGPQTKARLSDAWLRSTPRISVVNSFVEVYNDSKAEKSFEQIDFDDSSWEPAIETFSMSADNLHKPEISRLEIVSETDFQVIDIAELLGKVHIKSGCIELNASNPGSFPSVTLDFGRVMHGYPKFDIKSKGEGILTLSFSETLNLKQLNRLLLNADTKTYRSYGRRAFRYMKIEAHESSDAIQISNLSIDRPRYPVENNGQFTGPNFLKQIWDTARYTLELGMQDHWEDSLWRERILWVGDMHVCGLSNYFTAGAYNYDRKCLQQLAAIQHDDGAIPFGPRETTSSILGDYVCLYPVVMLNYCMYSGDLNIIEQLHESLNKLIVWFESITDESGKVDLGDAGNVYSPSADIKYIWFIDWHREGMEKKYTGAMFYIYGLKCLSKLAEFIDDSNLAARASLLQHRTEKFYRDMPFELRSASIAAITEFELSSQPIVEEALKLQIHTGYFNSYVCLALIKQGYRKEALELIARYWGEMLKRGATTFWEEFDSHSEPYVIPRIDINFDWSGMQSSCHAWSSGPCFLITCAIWDIKPLLPGFAEFAVKPFLNFEFNEVSSTIPTPAGNIQLECTKEHNKAKIVINHPKELTCKFDSSSIGIPATVIINGKCL